MDWVNTSTERTTPALSGEIQPASLAIISVRRRWQLARPSERSACVASNSPKLARVSRSEVMAGMNSLCAFELVETDARVLIFDRQAPVARRFLDTPGAFDQLAAVGGAG